MQGLMQSHALSIPKLLAHAAAWHGETQIVSVAPEGAAHRYTYAGALSRTRRLARALVSLGVGPGDRVATLAWNTWRHFELFFAVPGIGAVCHTVNPRLFEDQIIFILNHAQNRCVFFDTSFAELVGRLAPRLPHIEQFIVLGDAAAAADLANGIDGRDVLSYETLLAAEKDGFDWPALHEDTASSLCYTSGTTGDPKGVLYSHRSTVLHTYAACLPDCHNLSAQSVVMPVAPMFHANAWGLPYCAPAVGAKLVLPGRDVGGKALLDLIIAEGVTHSVAVPTVWLGFLDEAELAGGAGPLKRVVIGGTAVPRSMIERFAALGVEVRQGWGMTEMSPLGTMGALKRGMEELPTQARTDILSKQGRPICGVDMRITDDLGRALPHDGKAFGHLQVRGPWIIASYFRRDTKILDDEGWFDTGDIATIDAAGYMQITDRAKDVIKSGGEWISSIDLENTAMGHPGVAEAAVIGVAHPRWDERPLLILVARCDPPPSKQAVFDYLAPRIVKWWMPDDIVFVDKLPHTATGKVQKAALREQFKDYRLPTA